MPLGTRPTTLGALKAAVAAGTWRPRSVKDEVRQNLIAKLRDGEPLFPGIIGYDETVIPQIVNAILARHNFILLGLRGQAKTRILRALTSLLDEAIPVVPGSEINDDPLAPLSAYARQKVAADGDAMPHRLAAARRALRREAGDARRHHRRHDRRHRSDQGRARRAAARQRAGHALRLAAARQPRDCSPSTSCRISPARFRSACSTSCRKATSRSKASRFACRST